MKDSEGEHVSGFDDLEEIMSLGSYTKEISRIKKLMSFLF